MSQLTAKIEAFADLLPDWNSYGAAEISDTAIRKAVAAVEYLDDMALDESITVNAFPLPNGNVQIDVDLHYGMRGVEIECDSSGSATITYFDEKHEVVDGLGPEVRCQTIEDFLLNRI